MSCSIGKSWRSRISPAKAAPAAPRSSSSNDASFDAGRLATFPDGTLFMHKLEAKLATAMPQAAFRHYQKPNVAPVTDEITYQALV